jgi:HSP20 family protein
MLKMSIVRWTPFREMEAMHNEMNRLFSRFGGFESEQKNGGQWMLSVDVIETPNALKLKAALPGIDPKDVNIEVNDNTLTLMAQRQQEDKQEEGTYQWIEHQYGTFSRSITLPRHVDAEKIEARYANGMLELTIPKKESAKPRRIELQMEGGTRTLDSGSQTEPRQLEATNTAN